MTKLTRRGFIARTSVGAATAGVLAAAPALTSVADAATTPAAELTRAEMAGPIVLHVRDLSTAEFGLMVGEREIIFRDRRLVSRLIKATR